MLQRIEEITVMDSRMKKLKWNSILALLYQVILIATGLILPRCFLHFYGSEVNGLISSITQFLAFINICDMGISAVVSSSYYKPLAEKNTYEISKVFVYSKRFFNRVGIILILYIITLLVVYPTVIDSSFGFWFTFTLIASMGISQLGQYFIGISYQLLLSSDQKSYIQLIVNGITLLINTVTCIVLMISGASIQMVKLTTSIIYLLRPIAMFMYVRKKYTIDYDVPIDKNAITQKRNGIIQHIAYMIYENTDIMVITVFSSLKNVSIYTIYTLATNSIKQIIISATTGIQALLGNLIAQKEQEKLTSIFSFYNWVIHSVSVVLFTITGLMIVPFVQLYTSNITDANYYAPVFATLITVAYFLSSIRNANYALIRAAGHYKQTQIASLTEAILNLIISIVCVFKLGLAGVAVGTVIATLYFVVYETLYFSKNIVFIPLKSFFKQFVSDILVSLISVCIAFNIKIFNGSIISWLLQAVLVSFSCLLVWLFFQFVFYRDNLCVLKQKILKR